MEESSPPPLPHPHSEHASSTAEHSIGKLLLFLIYISFRSLYLYLMKYRDFPHFRDSYHRRSSLPKFYYILYYILYTTSPFSSTEYNENFRGRCWEFSYNLAFGDVSLFLRTLNLHFLTGRAIIYKQAFVHPKTTRRYPYDRQLLRHKIKTHSPCTAGQ